MSAADEAARVKAPIEGRIFNVEVTTAVARFAIPAAFAGVYCSFTVWGATGDEADIVFGDSACTVVLDNENSVSTEVITLEDTTGEKLTHAVSRSWIMPAVGEATHFAVDASATMNLIVAKA